MRKTYSNLLLLLFLLPIAMHAQEKTVTGVVTSADDQLSIPGVTVLVKGTTTGTVTDMDGIYTLSGVTSESIIVFSFIGMQLIEVLVAD